MPDYQIKKNGRDWDIYETQTEQVIETCSSVLEAQIVKTHLNRGGGFAGWTPMFMLQKYFQK
jgi:hypothetical protein